MTRDLAADSIGDYPLTRLVKIVARSSISDLWEMWGSPIIEALLWLVIIGVVFFVLGLLSVRAERRGAGHDRAGARS